MGLSNWNKGKAYSYKGYVKGKINFPQTHAHKLSHSHSARTHNIAVSFRLFSPSVYITLQSGPDMKR